VQGDLSQVTAAVSKLSGIRLIEKNIIELHIDPSDGLCDLLVSINHSKQIHTFHHGLHKCGASDTPYP
jgi:hypothetical protein